MAAPILWLLYQLRFGNSHYFFQMPNVALTRGTHVAGAEGPCKQVTSVSNGLVGGAAGGANVKVRGAPLLARPA